MFKKTALLTAIAGLTFTGAATAGVVSYTTAGHNDKDNFGGNMADLNGGESSGMDFMGSPDDPSVWEANSTNFGNEWQAQDVLDAVEDNGGNPIANSKLGWVVFDLGSSLSNLESMYIWNIREDEARGVDSYNVYHANTPTVGVPASPTGNSSNEYDFASGGWTQLGSTANMEWRGDSESVKANEILDLSSIASAQYIAIEILSNHGDANRTGLAEVAITQVPEPSSLALLGLGGLMIARRRRG